ncbi:hypothetical protein D9M72_631350 [compost metagenome]
MFADQRLLGVHVAIADEHHVKTIGLLLGDGFDRRQQRLADRAGRREEEQQLRFLAGVTEVHRATVTIAGSDLRRGFIDRHPFVDH